MVTDDGRIDSFVRHGKGWRFDQRDETVSRCRRYRTTPRFQVRGATTVFAGLAPHKVMEDCRYQIVTPGSENLRYLRLGAFACRCVDVDKERQNNNFPPERREVLAFAMM